MTLSYCEISEKPAFKFLVTELTPLLGEVNANREVFRDYVEYNGNLRTSKEIYNKLYNATFSPLTKPWNGLTEAELEQRADEEIIMTQKDMFKELGISVPKKELSEVGIIKLKQAISKLNNKLFKAGDYRIYKVVPTQVGEVRNNNFTWEIKVFKGKLNVEAKNEKLSTEDLLENKLPRLITQGTRNLERDLQNNIRTLLGINKNINGKQENSTETNNKVLGKSYADKFSENKGLLFGELQLETGDFREEVGNTLYDRYKNISKISEKTFQEIFNENAYTSEERRIYIVHRFNEALRQNTLNRALGNALGRLQGTNPKSLFPIRTVEVMGNNNILFVDGTNIYINVASDLEGGSIDEYFKNLYDSGTNLDEYVNIAIFEELIHAAVNSRYSSQEQLAPMKELFESGLIPKISKFYSGEEVKLNYNLIKRFDPEEMQKLHKYTHEYIRMIVQDKVLGTTTEFVKYPNLFSKIKEIIDYIWTFIKDALGTNKTPINNQIANQIVELIKNSELVDSQNEELTVDVTAANYSQQIIRKMADALGQQIGVNYSFINPQEAITITKNAENPWNEQKSFFFNGQVYFLEGSITPSDVLHEFVHPIIKNIAGTNKNLFNNLYTKLQSTNEGKKIIETGQELYPNLDVESNDFKEEVLVRSIEKIRDLSNKGLEVDTAFQKFVNDLLYTIKQLLRGIFGQKIKVSDLNPNTTLQELSDMLEAGGQFELDPEIITDKDLVAYKTEYNKYMQDFVAQNANAKEIEQLTNNFFDAMKKHLRDAINRNDLGELVNIMQNKYGTGQLQQMEKNLKRYQDVIIENAKELDDQLVLTQQRATAVVNSLNNVENMVKQLYDTLQELVKDIDNPDNVQKVQYIKKVLDYWGDFATEAKQILDANGIKNLKMVDNVVAGISNADTIINKFYEKASKDVLYNQLKNTAEAIDNKWKEREAFLKSKNTDPKIFAREKANYENSRITPEIIEQALKGQLKDLNTLNAYLEGYGSSPDPVIGGLASYVKDNETEVAATIQSNFNKFITDIKPDLDKNNYNPNRAEDIGKELGQIDKVGSVNPETGEFEEFEEWRFKNEFIGADLVRDRFRFNIKQAALKYKETGSDEDRQKLADVQAEWEQHNRDYFNSKYTEEYYQMYDLLKKDEIGKEAKIAIDELYDELTELNADLTSASAADILDILELIDEKRREIRQLSNVYDLVGLPKTGKELEIALRLQKFNEKSNEIHESIEIPQALQNAYQEYEQRLIEEGKQRGSVEFNDLLNKWIEKNTRKVLKSSYWDKSKRISNAIAEILSSVPQQQELSAKITKNYEIIREMVKGNRDESGQPLGSELSPEKQEIVKKAQEEVTEARASLDKLSGLSKLEINEKNIILAKLTDQERLSNQEIIRFNQLMNKQNSLGIGRVERGRLNGLFAELDELRTKEVTDSYVDTVNNLFTAMDSDKLHNLLNRLDIDKSTANKLSNIDLVEELFKLSKDFEDWFLRNHTLKEVIDYETGQPKQIWERTSIWNVIKPRDENYYEQTTIENLQGDKVAIQGLPALKYYKRQVKEKYLTPEIVGETIGNRGKGDWLPKTMAQGAKDDRYINKEYLALKKSNSDLYKLLEKTKKLYLDFQEGADKKNKRYLTYPSERKQLIERVRSDNPLERIVQRGKDFFTNVKDGWENGLNWNDNQQLVQLDLFDDERSGIPMGSISKLDIKEVSTNIMYTMMRYMAALETNKGLNKVAPVTRMIQDVVNNEKNQPLFSKIVGNSTIVNSAKKKDNYLRKKAVNNYIERVFEGQQNKGWGSESPFIQNLSKTMFKGASSSYLTLNIPSAIKNTVGMKFQSMIEAVAGKYMTTKEYVSSESEATIAMMKLTTEIYKQGPKSLDLQIIEIFDPERGKFSNQFGESISRTPGKDSLLILDRLGDFRKITQLQSSVQTLFAMMKHERVKKNGKDIRYLDAWELKNGKIQLKEGIDPSYGISYDSDGNIVVGENFKKLRAKYQAVLDNLNGAMGREDSPEAERYLAFRYVSFFRRFLTKMLLNRWAFSGNLFDGTSRGRLDYRLGDTKEGWYITFMGLMRKILGSGFKYIPSASAEEKAAFLRVTSEVGFVLLLRYLVLPLLFDWDPEDEDRFKKLKNKSGALPLPFVYDDPSRPFDLPGWLSNHAMLSIMQVNGENDAFIPFPGLGLSDYKQYLDVKSLVVGPTLGTALFDIPNDLWNIATDSDKARFKRDSNPYEWGQADEYKIWSHIAKSIGFNGGTIEPAKALQNFTSFENR